MRCTVLHAEHLRLGARMVDFAGWDMPVQYPEGILAEHLATRKHAGLFDVSHMGRFLIGGSDAVSLLERVLSNAASRLTVGLSHYTLLPDADGGAIDDAYLYRFKENEYLLVVNASNRQADWDHLQAQSKAWNDVVCTDISDATCMISLQGPSAETLLARLLGPLPKPRRNACCIAEFRDRSIYVSRTGYAGEPIGFELIADQDLALDLWTALIESGAVPVGLGARDTLRLEAALPLYGHEFGQAPDGSIIPIFACPLARFGVVLENRQTPFIGFDALRAQAAAAQALAQTPNLPQAALPRRIRALTLTGRGIARAGAEVWWNDRPVGWVTSGTMAPYWIFAHGQPTTESARRAIALALIDSASPLRDTVHIHTPRRTIEAQIVPRFLQNREGPYAVPIVDGDSAP